MNTNTALRSAGRIEYAVLRAPLRVVDEKVVQRFLPHDSVARRTFEQALGSLDEAAGRWLRDPDESDGLPVVEAAPPLAVPVADATAGSSDEPNETLEPVEEQIDHLTDELLEEQESETFAGELAEDDELRRVQAELNAKRLVAEQRDDLR